MPMSGRPFLWTWQKAGGLSGWRIYSGSTRLMDAHQTNWITYRGTAEAMRQQAFLHVAQVEPYDDTQTRRERLAEFMTEITSMESANWASAMRRASSAPNQT